MPVAPVAVMLFCSQGQNDQSENNEELMGAVRDACVLMINSWELRVLEIVQLASRAGSLERL